MMMIFLNKWFHLKVFKSYKGEGTSEAIELIFLYMLTWCYNEKHKEVTITNNHSAPFGTETVIFLPE